MDIIALIFKSKLPAFHSTCQWSDLRWTETSLFRKMVVWSSFFFHNEIIEKKCIRKLDVLGAPKVTMEIKERNHKKSVHRWLSYSVVQGSE